MSAKPRGELDINSLDPYIFMDSPGPGDLRKYPRTSRGFMDIHSPTQIYPESQKEKLVIAVLRFEQNYTNPFKYKTLNSFKILKDVHVRLEIFDASGKRGQILPIGYKLREPTTQHGMERTKRAGNILFLPFRRSGHLGTDFYSRQAPPKKKGVPPSSR